MAQSFKQAFAAARKAKGAGGTFSWNGKKWNTDYEGEKAGKAAPKKETEAAAKKETKYTGSLAGKGFTPPAAKKPSDALRAAAAKKETKYTGSLAGKGFTPPAAKKPSDVNSKDLPKAGGTTRGTKVVGGPQKHPTSMVVDKDSLANKAGPAVRKAISDIGSWASEVRSRDIRETEKKAAASQKRRLAAASSTKAAKGGSIKKLAKGGRVGDGCAKSGRTKGRFV